MANPTNLYVTSFGLQRPEEADVLNLVSDLALKAPLASPALTGSPTAPTQAPGDNSTKLATDAFVAAAVAGVTSPVTSVFTRTGAVVAAGGDYSVAQVTGAAPLASPTFTGTPAAPTPTALDSSTKVATTQFVANAVAGGGVVPFVFSRKSGTIMNGNGSIPNDYGDVSTVTGSSGVQTTTATLSASLAIFSGAINTVSGIFGSLIYRTGRNIHFLMLAGAAGKITDERYWYGLTDQTLATQGGNDNPAGNYAAFRFSTNASDTVWQAITKDGTTQNIRSTGVAPAINTTQAFAIVFDDVNNNVKFYINGTLVATSSSHLPSAGTNLRYVATNNCFASTTNNGFYFAQTQISSDF